MSLESPHSLPDERRLVEALFERMLDSDDPMQLLSLELDPAVAEAVRRLWSNHQHAAAENFLGEPVTLVRGLTGPEPPRFTAGQVLGGRFTIHEQLGSGGKPTGTETKEQAVQKWAGQVTNVPLGKLNWNWEAIDSTRKLKTIPLRMLAIVNRLDLGRLGASGCPEGLVCGAELRFVYAGVPGQKDADQHAYFSLILEFVVRDLEIVDFKRLAERWATLQTKPDLDPVLSETMDLAESVRIRVTGRRGSTWTFGEYQFGPAGIQQTDLTRQPKLSVTDIKLCQGIGKPLAGFLGKPDNAAAVASSDYSFDTTPGLPTNQASIQEDGRVVLTLHKDVALPAMLDRIRFSLSINSCVGCHGMETRSPGLPADVIEDRTLFDQIRYAKDGKPSKLSNFLTGSDSGEPSTDFTPFVPPVVVGCAVEAPEKRHCNDLLRRHLFLYTVLHLTSNLPADWKAALDAKGLTAWQSH